MRLFLALELPDPVRQRLAALQDRLRPGSTGWTWVRAESMHLTVRFLGEVSNQTDASARAGWRRVAEGIWPFVVHLGGCERFPTRGRPRVLWVEVGAVDPAGELEQLAEAVERAAVAAGFEPERRPFRPHLTLARSRRGTAARLPDLPVPPLDLALGADELVLFRSRLDPAGARYTALERFPFCGVPGGPGGGD